MTKTALVTGITGRIPGGILVRASSIDRDDRIAYELQEIFLSGMLAAMQPVNRERIGGHSGKG